MNKTNRSFLLIFLSTVLTLICSAQTATLSADAEYNGALFDKTKPVEFFRNGKLKSGVLKSNFSVGEITFAGGKSVEFYQDGSIYTGELVAEYKVDEITFLPGKIVFYNDGKVQIGQVKAGSFHRNLTVPVNIQVRFNNDKTIAGFNDSTVYSYRVLNMTLRGNAVEFVFDEKNEQYKLYQGIIHTPQLAGVLMITRNRFAMPLKAEAIVMPSNSSFTFFSNKPPIALQNNEYDSRWYYDGTFIVNNINFGKFPYLWFKGNRLMAVQVQQPVTAQTYNYSPNEFILLDDAGNVIPTQFINP